MRPTWNFVTPLQSFQKAPASDTHFYQSHCNLSIKLKWILNILQTRDHCNTFVFCYQSVIRNKFVYGKFLDKVYQHSDNWAKDIPAVDDAHLLWPPRIHPQFPDEYNKICANQIALTGRLKFISEAMTPKDITASKLSSYSHNYRKSCSSPPSTRDKCNSTSSCLITKSSIAST